MTDLEITKLCAEAMGTYFRTLADKVEVFYLDGSTYYNPLIDDTQAMALVKEFRLALNYYGEDSPYSVSSGESRGDNINLNRAICECVAEMQKGKNNT